MLIIIAGEQAAGKSKVAYSIVSGSEFIETTPTDMDEQIRAEITEKTEFIIFDEVMEQDLPKIKAFKNSGRIKIRKPYTNMVISYQIPKIIIVTQDRIL